MDLENNLEKEKGQKEKLPSQKELEKELSDYLSKKYGLEGKVEFKGHKNVDELVRSYSSSDLFVLPSLTESFGLVFIEAMSCGLPIVATKVGGIPSIVKNGVNGLIFGQP